MKPLLLPLFYALVFARSALPAAAQDKLTIATVSFLTGHWRGMTTDGREAEEIYSSSEGGVLVGASREFSKGKCVFYDLEVFSEKDGTIVLTPHPAGRKSPHSFPLLATETRNNRAVFENTEHDFPKRFVYELVGPDKLRITLTGLQKGKDTIEVYELLRVADKK